MTATITSSTENEIKVSINENVFLFIVSSSSINLSTFVEFLANTNETIDFDYSEVDKLITEKKRNQTFTTIISAIKKVAISHTEIVRLFPTESFIDGI
jgi:hypothetical protein